MDGDEQQRPPPPSLHASAPGLGGVPGEAHDPFRVLAPEDKAFLEAFGRKISQTLLGGALFGGLGAYGLARHMAWRRTKLVTFLGATLTPLWGWGYVVMQEKDRVIQIAQQLQLAAEGLDANAAASRRGGGGAPNGAQEANEALTRLFPPPPSASAAAAAWNAGMPRGFLGQPSFRPPTTGGSGF
mmetsp:Transcript_47284/g.151767  ORF Transcript_47284/g.151767 Transcript_47284/m.151767 type:complete len:185 (+) Transcript_47284:79-633(+)